MPKTDSPPAAKANPTATAEVIVTGEIEKPEPTLELTPEPTIAPTMAPMDEPIVSKEPDGKGVINFTIVLHLEGRNDGDKEDSFVRHASLLREYASLFERYGAKMTLESKEIIDSCINWNDNVLLEMQNRGHAVGIHADAGGEKSATIRSIVSTLTECASSSRLGVDATFASGVASKADCVRHAGERRYPPSPAWLHTLWSLDPALHPDGFEPYKNPADGHEPYPFQLEERIHPWLMNSGADWIIPSDNGDVLLIQPD
ncbi:MAG: hypothetical protein R2912_04335 [Eubacteriales bacterium]